MDSSSNEVVLDLSPLLKLYRNGHVERLSGCDVVPPSFDPTTNVESKDVTISKENNISARIFIPKLNNHDPIQTQKLPLLVYFHGGGFCIQTPFSQKYHKFLNSIVSQTNVIAVSVHYRRAPEHPLPIAYQDSWESLKWVASHINGNGSDEWINRYADFEKVFFSGDSAGANIAHHMGIRVGTEGLQGVNLEGIVLVHSYFWGAERIGSEAEKSEHLGLLENLWRFVCPTTIGSDDPLINPEKDPNLGKLGCKKVLICVAEKDLLKDRGWYYKELLHKIGWGGVVEIVETKGEDHVFHLFNPNCDNAFSLLNQITSFITNSG
ncbi:probable carboxylesterase 12 [Cicer arietinum]|uniref:Probable carboxylesterase 12 n=1 Tax=Cicer arietinum TaxID=3827 RepID=A0A1S2YI94_CICAR|nr:probable carboxylesterase 12 [Cicer arietinum]